MLLASEARMEGLAVLTNDERTRTFLCVELQQGVPQVLSVLCCIFCAVCLVLCVFCAVMH